MSRGGRDLIANYGQLRKRLGLVLPAAARPACCSLVEL